MSVSDPFLKRPLLTLVVSVLIVLVGLLSLASLDVENLPPIAPSRVSVSANYPGASAEVVEQGVTNLMERQLNSLERLETITSTSSANGARVQLSFRGNQGELDQINVQNEASLVSRQLPQPVSRQGTGNRVRLRELGGGPARGFGFAFWICARGWLLRLPGAYVTVRYTLQYLRIFEKYAYI